jgi:hypothetical protein
MKKDDDIVIFDGYEYVLTIYTDVRKFAEEDAKMNQRRGYKTKIVEIPDGFEVYRSILKDFE